MNHRQTITNYIGTFLLLWTLYSFGVDCVSCPNSVVHRDRAWGEYLVYRIFEYELKPDAIESALGEINACSAVKVDSKRLILWKYHRAWTKKPAEMSYPRNEPLALAERMQKWKVKTENFYQSNSQTSCYLLLT